MLYVMKDKEAEKIKNIDVLKMDNITYKKLYQIIKDILKNADISIFYKNNHTTNKKDKIILTNANHLINYDLKTNYINKSLDGLTEYIEKATELGIPEGELWNKLQNGEEITNNGKIIRPEQVLGKKRPGKKIGISGDTMPTKELEEPNSPLGRRAQFLNLECGAGEKTGGVSDSSDPQLISNC